MKNFVKLSVGDNYNNFYEKIFRREHIISAHRFSSLHYPNAQISIIVDDGKEQERYISDMSLDELLDVLNE